MVIASDLAWRKAKYSEWGNSYVTSEHHHSYRLKSIN